MPGRDKWPKELIPREIPEYRYGRVVNYGDLGEKDRFLIYCEENSPADARKYLAVLAKAGWKLEDTQGKSVGQLGDYILTISLNQKATLLSIDLTKLSCERSWPTKELPDLPPYPKGRSVDYTMNKNDISIGIYGTTEAGGDFYYRKGSVKRFLMMDSQGEGTWYFSVSDEDSLDEEEQKEKSVSKMRCLLVIGLLGAILASALLPKTV